MQTYFIKIFRLYSSNENVTTSFRLESVVYPLFTEPTHMVVFDVAFKRETYFDGSFGVLVKVKGKSTKQD